MMKQVGAPIVWGVRELKPIVFGDGVPDGKRRLRMRNRDAARMFIKTQSEIREYMIQDAGDHWAVNSSWEQGRNKKL